MDVAEEFESQMVIGSEVLGDSKSVDPIRRTKSFSSISGSLLLVLMYSLRQSRKAVEEMLLFEPTENNNSPVKNHETFHYQTTSPFLSRFSNFTEISSPFPM